ncbi:hypothetical protein COM13_12715 [Bacillus pseudomycoides]|uniref:hypothetical protein n=1 Tax=Bacillus TaxID=1386 RepID=UPI000BEC3CBA|nr:MULTISPECIES: hypothetical protein [Bacillus]MCX2828331.1 hypothetical protein [Bacillus sp. DHT2]MDR4915080.1 hypothetical protein [Bacillus pseudomycoides]PDX97632.1 hypothetical protein COO07_26230 [Bacillus pseudomycoides]PEE02894.1 hypothetical protein CON86_28525 [Bacillus pseudomycoides]PEK78085.1 hypothetical protein CN597_17425 [Bacillus pseudomycoides]
MPDTLRLIIFILAGISAFFVLIKEFKKPQKNAFLISFEFLILIGVTWLITKILV